MDAVLVQLVSLRWHSSGFMSVSKNDKLLKWALRKLLKSKCSAEIFKVLFSFTRVCVSMSVFLYAMYVGYLQRLEDGVRFPGVVVIAGHKLPTVGAVN